MVDDDPSITVHPVVTGVDQRNAVTAGHNSEGGRQAVVVQMGADTDGRLYPLIRACDILHLVSFVVLLPPTAGQA